MKLALIILSILAVIVITLDIILIHRLGVETITLKYIPNTSMNVNGTMPAPIGTIYLNR